MTVFKSKIFALLILFIVPLALPASVFAQEREQKVVMLSNGIITYDKLSNYPIFSKKLIPTCFDKETSEMVAR